MQIISRGAKVIDLVPNKAATLFKPSKHCFKLVVINGSSCCRSSDVRYIKEGLMVFVYGLFKASDLRKESNGNTKGIKQ